MKIMREGLAPILHGENLNRTQAPGLTWASNSLISVCVCVFLLCMRLCWGHRNESDTVPVPKLTVRVEEETNKCLVMCHRSSIFVD